MDSSSPHLSLDVRSLTLSYPRNIRTTTDTFGGAICRSSPPPFLPPLAQFSASFIGTKIFSPAFRHKSFRLLVKKGQQRDGLASGGGGRRLFSLPPLETWGALNFSASSSSFSRNFQRGKTLQMAPPAALRRWH
jgi:hypothetical protein